MNKIGDLIVFAGELCHRTMLRFAAIATVPGAAISAFYPAPVGFLALALGQWGSAAKPIIDGDCRFPWRSCDESVLWHPPRQPVSELLRHCPWPKPRSKSSEMCTLGRRPTAASRGAGGTDLRSARSIHSLTSIRTMSFLSAVSGQLSRPRFASIFLLIESK